MILGGPGSACERDWGGLGGTGGGREGLVGNGDWAAKRPSQGLGIGPFSTPPGTPLDEKTARRFRDFLVENQGGVGC